jgi:hypothetical protein
VEISEAVKAAARVVGSAAENWACQCGSLGYPPQARQVGPSERVVAYRWRTPPRPSCGRKVCVPSVLTLWLQPRVRSGVVHLVRGRGVLEQVVLVAVAVFEVQVEQFGVDVAQEFGGGGGVEGDLPGPWAEGDTVHADGPRPLASLLGFGSEAGPQPGAGADGERHPFESLVKVPALVEGEGPDRLQVCLAGTCEVTREDPHGLGGVEILEGVGGRIGQHEARLLLGGWRGVRVSG